MLKYLSHYEKKIVFLLHKRANIVTTSSNFKGYILIKSLLSYDSYPLYMREREREREDLINMDFILNITSIGVNGQNIS